jgi:integrase
VNTVHPIKNKRDIELIKKALGNPRDRLLFIIGINSSLRISDILKLKVGDVRNKTVLLLKEQKTGKSKQVSLNKSIIDAVKTLVPHDVPDNSPLFPSRKGDASIGRVQAYRILNSAAKRVGINTEIGTHTMRKTMAYHAYKSGVDLPLLMSALNHSSQRETLRYIGIVQEDVDAVFAGLNL